MPTIDNEPHPSPHFRIDSFSVPEAAREEFDASRRRNMAFIRTLPGFRGHAVFEKASGPTTFNIVTVATWESQEALERAGTEVRAYYQRIGFDLPAMLARWGVRAELGNFRALDEGGSAPQAERTP